MFLFRVPRTSAFNVLDERMEAQLDGVNMPADAGREGGSVGIARRSRKACAPEKVTVFAFFHLLDSDDVHVRLLGLKALEEGLGEDEVVAAPAGGVAGRQRFASDDPLYIE